MNEFLVSVIIPTYNGVDKLSRVMIGLEKQTALESLCEVIVVDDGSTAPRKEEGYNHLVASYPNLPITVIYSPINQGPAAARNLGVAHCRGNIIFFTDDDCDLPIDWLEKHLAIYASKPYISAVGGFYKTSDKNLRENSFDLTIFLSAWHAYGEAFFRSGESTEFRFASFPAINSANLSVKRYVFDLVRFDEDFLVPGSEDVFFSEEIRLKGFLMYYFPLFIGHGEISGLWRFLSFCMKRGMGSYVFYKKYGLDRYPYAYFRSSVKFILEQARRHLFIQKKKWRLIFLALIRIIIMRSLPFWFYYQWKYRMRKGFLPRKKYESSVRW